MTSLEWSFQGVGEGGDSSKPTPFGRWVGDLTPGRSDV